MSILAGGGMCGYLSFYRVSESDTENVIWQSAERRIVMKRDTFCFLFENFIGSHVPGMTGRGVSDRSLFWWRADI